MTATLRQRLRLGMALGALFVVAWIAWVSLASLLPFFFGLFLAWLLVPIVNLILGRLQRWRLTRRHDRLIAVLAVYVVGIGALVGIGFVLTPWVTDQTTELFDDREEILANLEERLQPWIDFYEERLPEGIRTSIEDWFERALTNAPGIAANLINQNVSTVFGFVVVPFWLFMVLKDQPKVTAWFYNFFPESIRPDVENLMSNASRVFGRYLRRQLLLGLFIGVLTVIPLLLLGIPFAVPLAVTAGILELVTIIGPIIATFIAVAVTLALSSVTDALIVLGIYIGIQQFENYIIVPRVHGRGMDIHPALVIMLIIVAGAVFGLIGVFVALPVAAVLRDSFSYVYRRLDGMPRSDAVLGMTGLRPEATEELEQIELPEPEEVVGGQKSDE